MWTSAPSALAIRPVASLDASTTTIWSMAPASRSGISSRMMAPMVRSSLRAGRHTDTVWWRSEARRSGGNSE